MARDISNEVLKVITGIDPQSKIIEGYVMINGKPSYDFEMVITEDKGVLQRTCGYGEGCFWTQWQ